MKILVAIDGSENSIRALNYAIALAGKMTEPSSLVLVNAHDDISLRGASQFVGKEAVNDYLDDLSRSELAEAIALAEKSPLPFESTFARGQVAQAIVKVASERAVDLIVLGSKGRSALSDLLIGSVATRVIAMAEIPVTLIK
jgi:nucleotide-binding universal stress UspA family protein